MQNFCCFIFLAVAQCWCHGIVVSVVVLTLLFRFHLSVFTGLVESPERGRELIAAQFVGVVVIKNNRPL